MKHLMAYATILLLITCVMITGPACIPAFAQKSPLGISGRLTTEDGALIIEARIKITNLETKRVFSLGVNDQGEYDIDLDPGSYDVEVEADNFKKAKRKSMLVSRAGRCYVDFVMKLDFRR